MGALQSLGIKSHPICEKCGHEMPKVPVVRVIAVITDLVSVNTHSKYKKYWNV